MHFAYATILPYCTDLMNATMRPTTIIVKVKLKLALNV